MKFLNKYIKKYWKLFFSALFFLILETVCDLIQPTIMSKIVDIGVAKNDMNFVLSKSMLMLGITGLGAIGATGRNIIASNVSQRFGTELRIDLFTKIQKLPFKTIDKYDGASLVTRLTNDVTQIQNFVNGLMRIFAKAPILCLGSLIMAIKLNRRMSLIFFAIIPIIFILIAINMKIGYPMFTKVQNSLDKVNSVMREYLQGVRVVKAFNRFDYETSRFEMCNENLTNISSKTLKIMAIFSPLITLSVNLCIVLILWIGGTKVNNGTMQVGEIIAFVNYMTHILFSLMIISRVFTVFVKASASCERINEIFSEKLDENEVNIKLEENNIKGKVEFNNVSFSYCDEIGDIVLNNINFTLDTSETLGIIGSTGSGKSTIANLIMGFYKPNSGDIKINNVNIENINRKDLRNKISIVPQKVVLFSGTIIDNIKIGKNSATYEEVEKASILANAHDFIKEFKDGYNTTLGQGGVNLSGGQKQRISIARALVKNPEILILDDSVSALDAVTEENIRNSLKEYSNSLTSIIIAQRITSVMHADKILVLDGGCVAGIGTHEELSKNCEVYKEILLSQVGKEMM